MTSAEWSQIVFFEKKEFDCKCGCGRNEMQLDFILTLDDLRNRLDFPLIVTSGYRCQEHNNNVSTTGFNGPHTTGRAADFALSGIEAFRAVTQCTLGGWMTGIGLMQHGEHSKRFVHFDNLDGGTNRPRLWTY